MISDNGDEKHDRSKPSGTWTTVSPDAFWYEDEDPSYTGSVGPENDDSYYWGALGPGKNKYGEATDCEEGRKAVERAIEELKNLPPAPLDPEVVALFCRLTQALADFRNETIECLEAHDSGPDYGPTYAICKEIFECPDRTGLDGKIVDRALLAALSGKPWRDVFVEAGLAVPEEESAAMLPDVADDEEGHDGASVDFDEFVEDSALLEEGEFTLDGSLEDLDGEVIAALDEPWRFVYFAFDWPGVRQMREWLEHRGEQFQIAFDVELEEFTVFTDYASLPARRPVARIEIFQPDLGGEDR